MNSKSFPPADDMIALIGRIDWQNVGNVALEGINEFLAIVEVVLAYVVAFCVVCYQKWQQHSVTDKVIKGSKVAYAYLQTAGKFFISTGVWLLTVAYPQARKITLKGYTQAQSIWSTVSDIYSLATSRQFVNL